MKTKNVVWVLLSMVLLVTPVFATNDDVGSFEVPNEDSAQEVIAGYSRGDVNAFLSDLGVEESADRSVIVDEVQSLSDKDKNSLIRACALEEEVGSCLIRQRVIKNNDKIMSVVTKIKGEGLETALERVDNRRARMALEQSILRIQEERKIVYDEVSEGQEREFIGRRHIKFLRVFPVVAEDRITYDEEGNVLNVKKNFWSVIFG